MSSAYNYWLSKAEAHFSARDYRAAETAFREAHRLAPTDQRVAYNLAFTLQQLGRVEEAVALFRTIDNPALADLARLNIALVDPASAAAEGEQRILAALHRADIDQERAITLLFGLGRIRHHQGRYDEAFEAFDLANRAKAHNIDFERLARHEATEATALRAAFTPDYLAYWKGKGHPSRAPIFVVGMPRSGTTLIEQILASHPDVTGMGEPVALGEAIKEHISWPPPPNAPADTYRAVAAKYLQRIKASGWKRSPRFVDKLPANYFHVGTIALAFPNAVILHSVRDPLDTCLSYFQNLFAEGHEFSYNLAHAGWAHGRYSLMMEHWARVLPGRVIDVRHEDLVADPERQIRWLVTEACGLSWDESCLRFHENDRQVLTPSKSQVRQPIFRDSVGRWRAYERHLGPLKEALEQSAAVASAVG